MVVCRFVDVGKKLKQERISVVCTRAGRKSDLEDFFPTKRREKNIVRGAICREFTF